LGFPCNQFGHQEIGSGDEILKILKHVRPGNGYVPKFRLIEKGDVNGCNAQPLYRYLRSTLPYREDCNHAEEVMISTPKEPIWNVLWSPLMASDVKWNFEKFLIDKKGIPRHRFMPSTDPLALKPWIEKLWKEI
jgi:glutathione peroxidase